MKLYLVHCGFYDHSICDGLYESHANFFLSADSFEDAKLKAKEIPQFKDKKMHIDGLQEVNAVDGHRIRLEQDLSLKDQSDIVNFKHRDLASKTK